MNIRDSDLGLIVDVARTLVSLDEMDDLRTFFSLPYPELAQRTLDRVVLTCLRDEADPPASLPGWSGGAMNAAWIAGRWTCRSMFSRPEAASSTRVPVCSPTCVSNWRTPSRPCHRCQQPPASSALERTCGGTATSGSTAISVSF